MSEIIRQSAVFTFTAPLPPPALRGNSMAHWRVRHRAANEYSEAVYFGIIGDHDWDHCVAVPCVHCFGLKQAGPVRSAAVDYLWRYAGSRPDLDNIARGIKVLQDVLCRAPGNAGHDRWYLGIIDDDGGLDPITFRREKVAHKRDEGVRIRLEPR